MALALLAAGCAGQEVEAPEGVETVTIRVGDEPLRVWVADTPDERSRGLQGVDGLPDGIDGMLFAWPEPGERVFHMEDTLIPLDIWWFDAGLRLVGSDTMTPCTAVPCPLYPSPGEVLRALETPAGERDLPVGAALSAG